MASKKPTPTKAVSPAKGGKTTTAPPVTPRPRTRLQRVLPVLVIALLTPIVCGVVWQAVTASQAGRQNPPPGQLIEVSAGAKRSQRQHLYCLGQGSPTVVFEAGIPEWSLHWRTVQDGVAKFTRACAYDRAGYGWSEARTDSRTVSQLATELHELLANAGERGPFVLAAHSLGGPISLLYAATYPQEVAGLVLVETWSPQMLSPTPDLIPESQRLADSLGKMAPFGLLRLARATRLLPMDELLQVNLLSPELRPVFREETLGPDLWNTMAAEYQGLADSAGQIGDLADLGSLPLVVIKAGTRAPGDYPPDAIWDQVQADLAQSSSQGQLVVAEGSGHFVQLEKPALVIETLQQVVGAANP